MEKCIVIHDPISFEVIGGWFPITVKDKLAKGKKIIRTRIVYRPRSIKR